MSQQLVVAEPILVSEGFQSEVPALPPTKRVDQLAYLATSTDASLSLVCKNLLEGDTRERAKAEAADLLPKMVDNHQLVAQYGTDALNAVNDLTDKMLKERPSVDIPELREAMKNLSRSMRNIGKNYDPSNPDVLEKYEKGKSKILGFIGRGKTFLQEFLDDIRTLEDHIDRAVETLEGKQYVLLKNVAYFDVLYGLNDQEIDKLIYRIGVMEEIRDLAVLQANEIVVGDSNLGDRGGEEQARILDFVQLLNNKITAYKGGLWAAWAMAPQIRNMRTVSLGLAARIDQTIDVSIPTMKRAIVVWMTLSDAKQAAAVTKAAEDLYNFTLKTLADATRRTVPAIAELLVTPALEPATITAWTESIAAQADGFIEAFEVSRQKRAEQDRAIITSKQVMDEATRRLNQAQLQYLLEAAKEVEEEPVLQIAKSVSAQIVAPVTTASS